MVDSSCTRSSVRAAGSRVHGWPPPYPWSEYPVLASVTTSLVGRQPSGKVGNSGKAQNAGFGQGVRPTLLALLHTGLFSLSDTVPKTYSCYWSFSAPKYLVVPSPFPPLPSPCHYAQPDQPPPSPAPVLMSSPQAHLGLPVIFPSFRGPSHQEEFLCDWGKLFNLSKLQTVPLGRKNEE